MAKGDNNDRSGSGSGTTANNDSLFTWNGGVPGNPGGNFIGWGESGFMPDEFSKVLGHDLNAAYSQGPKVFDQSLFAGIGPETQGIISSGLGQLSPVAGGSWLQGGNPYFEDVLSRSLADAGAGVNAAFAGSGTYGGLSHQNALADTLGGLSLNARYGNFNDEYNRMLGAQGQALGLSSLLDQNAQGQLEGANDLFRRQNDAAYQHVANTMGLFGNAQQTGAIQPEQRPFANLLGMGAGLAGLLFSDENLKEDIHEVGETNDGQPVFSFKYKDDPTETTHLGLMAQEVQKDHPEAVHEVGGFLAVDYGSALIDSMKPHERAKEEVSAFIRSLYKDAA